MGKGKGEEGKTVKRGSGVRGKTEEGEGGGGRKEIEEGEGREGIRRTRGRKEEGKEERISRWR